MPSRNRFVTVFFLIFTAAQLCYADEQKPASLLLLHDTAYILTAPIHWNAKDWTIFSLAVLGVAGTLKFADEPVFTHIQEGKEGNKTDAFSVIEPFGYQYAFGVVGGLYVAGTLFDKPEARLVARDSMNASLITLGLTEALKFSLEEVVRAARSDLSSFIPSMGINLFRPVIRGGSFWTSHGYIIALPSTVAKNFRVQSSRSRWIIADRP
jgi:hypothetical protein